FTGTKIVKAFGREGFEQTRLDRLNNRLLSLALKDIRIDELSKAVMEVLGAVSIVGIVWYAGSLVLSGVFTPGEVFSFIAGGALRQRAAAVLPRAPPRRQHHARGPGLGGGRFRDPRLAGDHRRRPGRQNADRIP